jgi:hypothetical protein
MGYLEDDKKAKQLEIDQLQGKLAATMGASVPGVPKIPEVIPSAPGIPEIKTISLCVPPFANIMSSMPTIPTLNISFPKITLPDVKITGVPDLTKTLGVDKLLALLSKEQQALLGAVPTEAQVLAAIAANLKPLPAIPPIPSLPPLPALKIVCSPPVEATSSKTLMPDPETGKNGMDTAGVNQVGQIAILGEVERQKRVPDFIAKIQADLPNISALASNLQALLANIVELTDPTKHPTTTSGWKDKIDTLISNLTLCSSGIFARGSIASDLYQSCLNPNEPVIVDQGLFDYTPSNYLKIHAEAFKRMHTVSGKIESFFETRYFDTITNTLQSYVSNTQYAIWEANGTPKAIDKYVTELYNIIVVKKKQGFKDPDQAYNFEADEFTWISKSFEAIWDITIKGLQGSLPDKG